MQKKIILSILVAFMFALSGCVNRTVRNDTQERGSGKSYGSNSSEGTVIAQKRVWIWQKEFHNP